MKEVDKVDNMLCKMMKDSLWRLQELLLKEQ